MSMTRGTYWEKMRRVSQPLPEMKFQVFHDYNRMVRRGFADPLLCDHCKTELTLRLGAFGDEPWLQCFGCGTIAKPGKRVYDDVCRAVAQYKARRAE